MEYSIELTPAAMRALEKLTDDVRQRVGDTINALASDPRPPGVRRLSGSDDIYRVRTGDYRILYQIHDKALVVLVVYVGHRRDVYR
jgi:mRNA interferase RelE/StbE